MLISRDLVKSRSDSVPRMRIATRCVLILSALTTLVGPVCRADIASRPRRLSIISSRGEDAVLGGGFVVGTLAIRPLDKSAAHALQTPDRQTAAASIDARRSFVRTIAHRPAR